MKPGPVILICPLWLHSFGIRTLDASASKRCTSAPGACGISAAPNALCAASRWCGPGAQAATSAPLIERSIQSATGIVYNITGGSDLTLQEVNQCAPRSPPPRPLQHLLAFSGDIKALSQTGR